MSTQQTDAEWAAIEVMGWVEVDAAETQEPQG